MRRAFEANGKATPKPGEKYPELVLDGLTETDPLHLHAEAELETLWNGDRERAKSEGKPVIKYVEINKKTLARHR